MRETELSLKGFLKILQLSHELLVGLKKVSKRVLVSAVPLKVKVKVPGQKKKIFQPPTAPTPAAAAAAASVDKEEEELEEDPSSNSDPTPTPAQGWLFYLKQCIF
jgi:hypothetical protein